MSALRQVAQGFRNLWGQADDDYEDATEEFGTREESQNQGQQPDSAYREPSRDRDRDRDRDSSRERSSERYEKFTAPTTSNYGSTEPDYTSGGSTSGGARRLRSVSMPLRASREKNIYTLKPKSLDEATLAADYLKTGCAVVVNLEFVDNPIAIRIMDFMSGVCYGLENQGHAMKLGEKIFLFTPGDFELTSDETEYAENRDLIFKDVNALPESAASSGGERRSWER